MSPLTHYTKAMVKKCKEKSFLGGNHGNDIGQDLEYLLRVHTTYLFQVPPGTSCSTWNLWIVSTRGQNNCSCQSQNYQLIDWDWIEQMINPKMWLGLNRTNDQSHYVILWNRTSIYLCWYFDRTNHIFYFSIQFNLISTY